MYDETRVSATYTGPRAEPECVERDRSTVEALNETLGKEIAHLLGASHMLEDRLSQILRSSQNPKPSTPTDKVGATDRSPLSIVLSQHIDGIRNAIWVIEQTVDRLEV